MTPEAPKSTSLPEQYLAASLEMLRSSGRAHMIPIRGHSMLPLIQDGDQLMIVPGVTDIHQGDIVLFQQGNQLIAHRVLAKQESLKGPTLLTKGDNVLLPDPTISLQQVIGRVTMIQRGHQQIALDTATWQRLGQFLALLMLAWSWLFKGARKIKHKLGISHHSLLMGWFTRLARGSLQLLLKTLQLLFSG